MVEFEFLVLPDGQVCVTQRRVLTARVPMLFQSVGEVAGPVVDLRDAPRRASALGERGSIVVLPQYDDSRFDAFALLWQLAIVTSDGQVPAAIVLVHGDEDQTGLAAHLRWLATFVFPQLLVFRAHRSELPDRIDHLSMRSDGNRLIILS